VEFFLGIIFAVLVIGVVGKFAINQNLVQDLKSNRIIYRQSHIFDLVKPAIPYLSLNNSTVKRQSKDFEAEHTIKVIFAEDKAYWIKDSSFYEANLVNGEIDNSSTKVVDTMTMDKVELDKIIFIVDKLTEGTKNDGRGSGV
jgi:hypothetical protein